MNLCVECEYVSLDEIAELFENQPNIFLENNFSSSEIEYCESRKKKRLEHYAARLAVKKAFFKACHKDVSQFSLNQIAVTRNSQNFPSLLVPTDLLNSLEIKTEDSIFISLAHEREMAVGYVMIIQKVPGTF